MAAISASATQRNRRRTAREGGHNYQWKDITFLDRAMDLDWRARWEARGSNMRATTWKTPWPTQILKLYEDLPKHAATALFLLRTEVIGLNAWLADIGVPEATRRCPCGAAAQTVRHILLHCPDLTAHRLRLLEATGFEDLNQILSTRTGAKAASRLLLNSGLLRQFDLAKQLEQDSPASTTPLDLDSWL